MEERTQEQNDECLGHILQMYPRRVPRKLLTYKLVCRRDVQRPGKIPSESEQARDMPCSYYTALYPIFLP